MNGFAKTFGRSQRAVVALAMVTAMTVVVGPGAGIASAKISQARCSGGSITVWVDSVRKPAADAYAKPPIATYVPTS